MNYRTLLALLAVYNVKAGWKVDDKGVLVLSEGNPVWIADDGKEMMMRGDTISRINGEAKAHREAKEAAEAKLKAFDGLDAADVRTKLEKYKDVDLSKMVAAGKLDEVRAEVTRQAEAQIAAEKANSAKLASRIEDMTMSSAFNNSAFMRDRVAVPAEMIKAVFGKNFKIEDDKIVAYDNLGNRLPSKKAIGDYASFDEALEMFVEAYPHKDAILKPVSGTGSGNKGGGGLKPGSKFIKRAEFDQLPPIKQAEAAALMAKGEMSITD